VTAQYKVSTKIYRRKFSEFDCRFTLSSLYIALGINI
jgi:hypothetical protein